MNGSRLVPRAGALLILLSAALHGGCFSRLISPYSETAYQYATSLKVESLLLMEKATEPYSHHEAEVQALLVKVQKALEYAKGRPRNEYATKQWTLMLDPAHRLLGGFLKRWKEDGNLGRPFIEEAKKLISDDFDQIIGLESGRDREPADTK